ncbi:uncharacterized protein BX664DRAFT_266051 [Halteromyces radiatus]|uniref:uncharacterized protein n=1 Tax=Halteromyces radiatus TaxID=101107 RepID=UPI00221F2868|nr:uncharacterized protein BX664DRAFT_266051 [Halteromyces radiatus]KAI8084720.1 hypothetical protein BX664DRAFT_266051 [Halteromyces radiatus]
MTIKTQSGFPYSLDISHLNPVQAVIGYGDSAIKVWKYKQVHGSGKKGKQQQPNFYESTTFWQGLRGQIERTICHPTLDGQVAFSTQYGHVGIYDIYNSKCDIFRQHHSGSNGGPSLAWAGDLSAVLKMNKNYDDDDDQNTTMIDTLITCSSDGSNTGLYLRDVNHRSRTPIDLDQVLENINPDWYTLLKTKNTIRSFVSVNPSFQYMALGNGDGSLEIYSLKTLKLIYVSNYQRSIITALHWKDYSLLASGCQAGIIAIHHIKQDINIDPTIPIIETSTYHHQREHTKTITDLKWSHHTDQVLLASSSLDNLVFVWSLEPEFKVIGCFDQHRGRVFSICWQYLEPDILFSGGEDKFVYMWNWNGHPLNRDTTSKVTETLFEATRNAIETEDLHQLQRQCYLTAVTLHYPDQDPMITINEIKNRCDTVDDYISKYISLENLDEKSESPHLSLLLGNKNDVRTLIGIEQHHGMKFGSDVMGSDVKLALNIMRSQYFILESYLHAGNGMMLTDWIALALTGKETWLKLMEEQANKLAEGGYHHLAATCFLACSKVYEAINVYRRASMYKEAIAMLKVRLPIDDPLLPTLLSEWAQQLQSKGNEELAALW